MNYSLEVFYFALCFLCVQDGRHNRETSSGNAQEIYADRFLPNDNGRNEMNRYTAFNIT